MNLAKRKKRKIKSKRNGKKNGSFIKMSRVKLEKMLPLYKSVFCQKECIRCRRYFLSCKQIIVSHLLHFAHDTANCRNPHNSSN